MLTTQSRPRNLRWFHAGPLLYGDWGTSRLYVLGLAFLYTGHASVVYLAAIGVLMLAVSWAYTVVCRSFPDGGGVYTAARQLSPTLSVVGATLLLSGYIMTAAISVVEAFHYFGVHGSLTLPLSLVTLGVIGVINWLGAKSAGRFALAVAFAALAVSGVMTLLAVPYFFKGLQTISFDFFREQPIGDQWVSFTKICLALAGVEAVANMTGLMRHPVDKTSKRTIWPVTIEVVALNMVFGIALTGLAFTVNGVAMSETHEPHAVMIEELEAAAETGDPAALAALPAVEEEVATYTDTAMKLIAKESGKKLLGDTGGAVMGQVAGVTFGLLLLSATNTAVMAMVSVLFAMGQDRELPRALTRLNYSGVPVVGLIVSVVIPAAVIAVERDVTVLAKLYVLGVCGAITVTLISCARNKDLDISARQRTGIAILGAFLGAVSVTIGVTQLESLAFSGGLVAIVLATRAVMLAGRKKADATFREPTQGWLPILRGEAPAIDPSRPKIMLAARGRHQAEFAVDLAKRRGATLFTIYVRTLRLMDTGPIQAPTIDEDPAGQAALGSVAALARANDVPMVPIYVTSSEIAEEILDYTVTYGCDTLIMGKSRRPVFARAVQGDVIAEVASGLPDEVALITRAGDTPHKHSLTVPDDITADGA